MPVPSQGHYGFHSFPVVDWFCLFIYLWVLTFPLGDCSEFVKFIITLICTFSFGPCVVRSSIYRFWLSPWVSSNSSYGLNLLSDAEQNISVFWWGKCVDSLIFKKKSHIQCSPNQAKWAKWAKFSPYIGWSRSPPDYKAKLGALFLFGSHSFLTNNLRFMVKLIDKTIVINGKIHTNKRERLYSSNKEGLIC